MDGKIKGMEMHWRIEVACTSKRGIMIADKKRGVEQVYIAIECNHCEEETVLVLGESYPGGEVKLGKWVE